MKWLVVTLLLVDPVQLDNLVPKSHPDFDVTVTLSADTLHLGDSLVATARVHNHGSPIAYWEDCHTIDGITLSVRRDTSTVYVRDAIPCESHCCTYLAANDSVVVTVVLDGKLPLDRTSPDRWYMPAGDYTIMALASGNLTPDLGVVKSGTAVFHWTRIAPSSMYGR